MARSLTGLTAVLALCAGMLAPFACCLVGDCAPAGPHPCCPEPADATSIQAPSCCDGEATATDSVVPTQIASAASSSTLAGSSPAPLASTSRVSLLLPAAQPLSPTTQAALSQVLLI